MNTDHNQTTRRATMTDRTDHYAESESLAATAGIRDSVDRMYATKTDIYLAAIHKSLLAIADALAAADRYAANEERQREEAEPDPLDDASIEEVLTIAAKASKRWARTLELLKQAEEEERQQQREEAEHDPLDENDHRDRLDGAGTRWTNASDGCWASGTHHVLELASLVGPLTFAPDAEPDPLDENDHRDRLIADRRRIVRHGQGHWHTPATSGTWCDADCTEMSLQHWARAFGPLAFATDAAQETPRADEPEMSEAAEWLSLDEDDPLDEDDHRDRQDCDGMRLIRVGSHHWHPHSAVRCGLGCNGLSLANWNEHYGPLTFAPEPPSEDSSTHYYPTNIDRATDGTTCHWSWEIKPITQGGWNAGGVAASAGTHDRERNTDMTDIWTMRDIEFRDDSGAPWETTGTLAALADYIDGGLLSDLTDSSEAEEELRDIAARMRTGKWDNYDRLSLERFGIYFRLGAS